PQRPAPAFEPSEPPAAPKAPPRPAAAEASDEQTASRVRAKKVFEAKFREPNPRMPFYIAMGALGAFTLGTAGYFWYQLRPAPAPPARSETVASVARSAVQVHPKVEAGYAAYLAGELAAARAEYQQGLREEPANRDAMLGLAALDVRAGRYEAAEALYLRVLQV